MRHRLALFCAAQGLEVALLPELVEAFVAEGLPGKAASTKGTYRSVLRSLGGSGRPVLATPFSGSPARAPYNAGERAELASVAASQPSPWRRASASAFLALGVGAGLRAGELAAATGDDVITGRGRLSVHVGAGRVVPVTGVYAKDLARQAKTLGRATCSAPVALTAATGTSLTISATSSTLTRPRPGCPLGGPVPVSSATIWQLARLFGNCSI